MAGFTQENRLLALTTPLGPDALLAVSLRGTEAVSRLFEFELEVAAPIGPPLAFDRILGQSVSLELRQGDGGRWFSGVVTRLTEAGKDQSFLRYRARLSPKMWLLTRTRRCRVFQRRTTPEILREVLAGLDAAYALTGVYPARNYCVQYQETDFDFVSRLMEEDGIWYAFAHGPDRCRLLVSDDAASSPRLPGGRGVALGADAGRVREEWQVSGWEKSQELRAVRCVVRDHSFEMPGDPLEAERPALDEVKAGAAAHKLRLPGTDDLELYEYPGRYAKLHDRVRGDGGAEAASSPGVLDDRDRLVRTRMEAEECASLTIEGAGNCGAFAAGTRFDLECPGDAAGSYLLTRVDHDIRNAGFAAGVGDADSYANTFACVPAALRYRPARVTPRPSIAGVQTATVTGPAGEELFCDKYGRVKVQFHWDREGRHDADSSCWLRVAQVWAGKGWGAFFWPRVGHEVVVAFEDGDPDCPMIVGSVYNAANMPPYAMPAGKQLGGIRSASVRGAARQNYNTIVFNDEKGGEHLAIHSERNLTLNSEYDRDVTAGRHRGERVSNSSLLAVGTMPGGGSGGGGAVDTPQPINAAPGLNAIWVFGENMQAALGLNHQVAFGNNQQICVNPAGLVAGMGAAGGSEPLLTGLLGGGAGNVQLTVGANVQLTMGQSFQINLGPKGINVDGDGNYRTHAFSFVFGLVIGLAAAVYALGYGLLAAKNDFVGCGTFTAVYQATIDLILETIMVAETGIARYRNGTDKLWNTGFVLDLLGDAYAAGAPGVATASVNLSWADTYAALGALITASLASSLDNKRMHEEERDAGS